MVSLTLSRIQRSHQKMSNLDIGVAVAANKEVGPEVAVVVNKTICGEGTTRHLVKTATTSSRDPVITIVGEVEITGTIIMGVTEATKETKIGIIKLIVANREVVVDIRDVITKKTRMAQRATSPEEASKTEMRTVDTSREAVTSKEVGTKTETKTVVSISLGTHTSRETMNWTSTRKLTKTASSRYNVAAVEITTMVSSVAGTKTTTVNNSRGPTNKSKR